jgi:hypothetical protein
MGIARTSGRPTGPPWNKTLAEPIEQTEFGDSSPSRVATDDCDNIVPECPHPSLANSRSRPVSAIRAAELGAVLLTFKGIC